MKNRSFNPSSRRDDEVLLSDVLHNISPQSIIGETAIPISGIFFDSRNVVTGSLFVAIKGIEVDGHNFIEKAIKMGASAILCERFPGKTQDGVTYIQVKDAAGAMGTAASNFYGNPSANLTLIGVTGTNGKTSTATLLFRLFRKLGNRCGLLSTVQNQFEDEIFTTSKTTPDSVEINCLLAKMLKSRVTHCFMEVTSHAVVQKRIAGLTFAGAIFTNLTHDHLDYHKSFEEYFRAKKGFFDQLPASAFALVNNDDERGAAIMQDTVAGKHSFSLQNIGTFNGTILSDGFNGLQMNIDGKEGSFKLIGKFNAYNLLGVYSAAVLMGEDGGQVFFQLSDIQPPPGRFEQVVSSTRIVGIVDYAHTPDALKNVLETIQNLREGDQKILTIVGCGGDRDFEKRPIMAKIACELSDSVILTSDNPREEDPFDILAQMQKDLPSIHSQKIRIIENRREAIRQAVEIANAEDIILVAGKGHENYQEIKGIKQHFDDKEELQKVFLELGV